MAVHSDELQWMRGITYIASANILILTCMRWKPVVQPKTLSAIEDTTLPKVTPDFFAALAVVQAAETKMKSHYKYELYRRNPGIIKVRNDIVLLGGVKFTFAECKQPAHRILQEWRLSLCAQYIVYLAMKDKMILDDPKRPKLIIVKADGTKAMTSSSWTRAKSISIWMVDRLQLFHAKSVDVPRSFARALGEKKYGVQVVDPSIEGRFGLVRMRQSKYYEPAVIDFEGVIAKADGDKEEKWEEYGGGTTWDQAGKDETQPTVSSDTAW
ncbi:hypothetical protein PV08_04542 [Exophiala spinifera]|uniref:Uncharacterized protein n=1 Tax=Exophiala spinifera TaxID=91928 RepID=A0A0D2BFG1_9EURO|nr:uncharacterized protein PV08_04542 [Exophiala spinifera]KIW17350.1 hypothetical protein PV08_04542 [Exophiala spinifera]